MINKDSAPTGIDQAHPPPRDYAELLHQLEHADPAVRRGAARDLFGYPEASASLLRRLQIEPRCSVRGLILTSLTRLGDDVAVSGLVNWLRSVDAMMRKEAIAVMKELPDEMVPIIDVLLGHADGDVRMMAVNMLESLRHPQTEAWLVDVISKEPVVNVCGIAIDLLGVVGTTGAQATLESLKQRFPGQPYIWFAADAASKRIANR